MASPAVAASPIGGTWLTEDGKTIVRVAPCKPGASTMCAVVKKRLADAKEGDAGTRLMWDLTDSGASWKGSGFHPGHGVNFKAEVTRSGNRLKIKGCKAFVCQSQFWTPTN